MAKVKISIITGFLGSGKTTLLSEILKNARYLEEKNEQTKSGKIKGAGFEKPSENSKKSQKNYNNNAQNPPTSKLENLAVIVNELGDVGLDNTILNAEFASEFVSEDMVLLNAGCACCNKRNDLIISLRNLLDSYDLKHKKLDRVIIETTGLANPAPILWTILSDGFLSNHFEIAQIITCIDALNGLNHLKHAEAINQIVASDCIVVTKSDINSNYGELKNRIYALYSNIKIYDKFDVKLEDLFAVRHVFNENLGFDFGGDSIENSAKDSKDLSKNVTKDLHNDSVSSICIELHQPIEWNAFSIWLSLLLHKYGEQMLRVKGLIDIGQDFLISINALNHIVHPPAHIRKSVKNSNKNSNKNIDFDKKAPKNTSKPESNQECKIVFIAKDLDLNLVRESFQKVLGVQVV